MVVSFATDSVVKTTYVVQMSVNMILLPLPGLEKLWCVNENALNTSCVYVTSMIWPNRVYLDAQSSQNSTLRWPSVKSLPALL